MSTAEIISGMSSESFDSLGKLGVSWLRHPDNKLAVIKMEKSARIVMGIEKQLCERTVIALIHP